MRDDGFAEIAVLTDLGRRLAQARLGHALTQQGLADAAAVSKRTVERLEKGESVQLSNLVRVLGALGLGRNLDLLVPASGPRPMALLRHQGKTRKRQKQAKAGVAAPWTWNDGAA